MLDGPAGRLVVELDRGLAPRRKERHPDIQEWVDAITAAAHPEHPEPASSGSATTNRARRPLALAALILVAVLAGAGAGWLARGTDAPPARQRDVIDGRQRLQVVDDGTVAAIFGPRELRVGDQVRLDAGVTGAVSYFWIDPAGDTIPAQPSLTIPELTADTDSVSLVVVRADGRPVSVTYDLAPTNP